MNIILEPLVPSGTHHQMQIYRDVHTALAAIGAQLEVALAGVPQVSEVSLGVSQSNSVATWPTYKFVLTTPLPFAEMSTHHHSDERSQHPSGQTISLTRDVIDEQELSRVISHTVKTIVDHVRRLLKEALASAQDSVRQLQGAVQFLEPTSVS